MKNKILFITTQYRVGERVYPILPHLSKIYDLDILKLYQMDSSHKWVGDNDPRVLFDKNYIGEFKNVYLGSNISNIDFEKYDLILADDNRGRNCLPEIYSYKKCPMIGCSHGNTNKNYLDEYHKVAFDKCFVFGNSKKERNVNAIPAGIPANDALKNYINKTPEHILIIVNFLGNRNSPFEINFNEELFKHLKLHIIQKKFDKKILIKLKSRADEKGYKHNVDYLKSILPGDLDYEIAIDVEDDNLMVAKSCCVISAPSTMTLKPIQLGIPTVIIEGTGQSGVLQHFHGYINTDWLYNTEKLSIDMINLLNKQIEDKTLNRKFIEKTLHGGNDFNSTQIFLNEIGNIING